MKDQYLTNMQFAEKLMQFLCSKQLFGFKALWNPKLVALDIEKEIYIPKFYEEIFYSVYYIINENVKDIQDCFDDFLNDMAQQSTMKNDIDDGKFTRYALKIAPLFFSEGYSHGSFLAYCSMVIGVAYNFLLLKPNSVPQRGCQVVALVLFAHQMTAQFYEEGGWTGFKNTALHFNSCIDALHEKRNTFSSSVCHDS